MALLQSRTAAVVAGAAVLALLGGGAAVADKPTTPAPGHTHPGTVSEPEALESYQGPVPAGEKRTVYAECPEGKVAIGGGFAFEQATDDAEPLVFQSAASTREGDFVETDNGIRSTAWEVVVKNNGGGTFNANPWVVCATVN